MYGDLARSPGGVLAADHRVAPSALPCSGQQTFPLPAADHSVKGHEPPAAGSRVSRCQQQSTLLAAADHPVASNRVLRCWQQTTVLMATDRPLPAADGPEKIHPTPHALRNCLCPSPLGQNLGFHAVDGGIEIGQPGGRKRIAQRFIAGFAGARGMSPDRDGRTHASLPPGFFRPCGVGARLESVSHR